MNAPRSGFPINLTLEALGDRWSLIVIRHEFSRRYIALRLHRRGVTHVVVHRRDLGPERFSESAKIASLQWQDDDGDVDLYKLR